ncbi:MAG: aminotransferase class III-fold pyridoxal phosphate-dependent enzyme [Candidatus Diapherotrites archaeon]|nr:aminotransferase class III-fold pyridoxal phosphate-dependent enzyme [Candidatus Diapherotrites archaeon]
MKNIICKAGPKSRKIAKKDDAIITKASVPRERPTVLEKGKGVYLWDKDNVKYLDFSSLIAVSSVGHGNPDIYKAIKEQAAKITHVAGNDFYHENMPILAEMIANSMPIKGKKRVFFSNSGTESVECAMKLARYYTKRTGYLAMNNCFHGRTFGSVSMTNSKMIIRAGFEPFLPVVAHTEFPYCYRCPFGETDSNSCGRKCLDYIERVTFKKEIAPKNIAALFVEPIQGEGGYIPAPDWYFKELKKICSKHGILFVADEVQSGMGRTGKMWAMEHYNTEPDIICSAKALGGGMPLGATVFKEKYDVWEAGSHSNTFGGNAVCTASSIAALNFIKKKNLVRNAEKVGKHILSRMKEIQEKSKTLGDVRGKGLMIGLEFVKDKKTKAPNPKFRLNLMNACLNDKLLLLGGGKSVIRIAPPLVITKEEADKGIDIIEKNLKELE